MTAAHTTSRNSENLPGMTSLGEQHGSHSKRPGVKLGWARRALASTGVTLAMLCGGTAIAVLAAAPAQAADIDGIYGSAVARYSCGAHTVYVTPFTFSELNGNWPFKAQASVYDNGTGQWITSSWYEADGITALTFSVSQPSRYAYVTFAHDGKTASEWVEIKDDLDNVPPFC